MWKSLHLYSRTSVLISQWSQRKEENMWRQTVVQPYLGLTINYILPFIIRTLYNGWYGDMNPILAAFSGAAVMFANFTSQYSHTGLEKTVSCHSCCTKTSKTYQVTISTMNRWPPTSQEWWQVNVLLCYDDALFNRESFSGGENSCSLFQRIRCYPNVLITARECYCWLLQTMPSNKDKNTNAKSADLVQCLLQESKQQDLVVAHKNSTLLQTFFLNADKCQNKQDSALTR